MNLLQETIDVLEEYGKSPADVVYVGNDTEYAISWDEFALLADKQYNSGMGGQEVCSDLLVVGNDFWLERHQYDGSEWWEYKKMPIKPKNPKKIKYLFGMYWKNIKQTEEDPDYFE